MKHSNQLYLIDFVLHQNISSNDDGIIKVKGVSINTFYHQNSNRFYLYF